MQELIRVGANLDEKPAYRPIYWNCHDIGCRLAFLAAIPGSDLTRLSNLSGTFERAKFSVQISVDSITSTATSWAETGVRQLESYNRMPLQVPHPLPMPHEALALRMLYSGFKSAWRSIKISDNIKDMVRRAIYDRHLWAGTLNQRFPNLQLLNDVTHHEWDLHTPKLFWESFRSLWRQRFW